MIIQNLKGDATIPQKDDHRWNYLLHGCNNRGAWGSGFAKAVNDKWKEPRQRYIEWFKGTLGYKFVPPFELGEFIGVDTKDITVLNIITQDGYGYDGKQYAKLWAINKGISLVRDFFILNNMDRVTLHMPRIGSGLGGLEWKDVNQEITKVLYKTNFIVKVYTL